ncbi:putative Ig domain-containing protein, partial [Rubripirellula amarantea]|nr:putative Ig domain-containing protein [Rubripirellula amarantea]
MTVGVSSSNSAPLITSLPPTRVLAGTTLQYRVEARDVDGDQLTWRLIDGPAGLTVAANGNVNWIPKASDLGTTEVTIAVADDFGNETEQNFELSVVSQIQNTAPEITSTPSRFASDSNVYRYVLESFDAENDPVQFELRSGPRGAAFDSTTSTVVWQPDDNQYGEQEFVVRVTDVFGAFSDQVFRVDVRCGNLAPAITSLPGTRGVAGRFYTYAVRGDDPEKGELTFALQSPPSGMTIDPTTGLIRWRPTTEQIGNHTVSISVTDPLGATGTQSYTIAVSDPASSDAVGRSITITSAPVYTVDVGETYSYPITVQNAADGAVTYALADAPTGLEISSAGLISWNPTAGDLGEHVVSVTATNSEGTIARQTYLLSVVSNVLPEFVSSPTTQVTAGETYRYLAKATDADLDPLRYRVVDGPDGLTVSQSGNVLWTTEIDDIGSHPVTLSVSDGRGGTNEQAFSITVGADAESPTVSLAFTVDGIFSFDTPVVNPGATFIAHVIAADNIAVQSRTLEIDGQTVPIDALGRATLTAPQTIGELVFVGTATDTSGNRQSQSERVGVVPVGQGGGTSVNDPSIPALDPNRDPADQSPPAITITSPVANAALSNVTTIVGTVDDADDNLRYYRVFAARLDRVDISLIDVSDPDWEVLATSSTETIDGTLATFDPSTLSNDPYVIAVAAYDHLGNASVQTRVVNVEGNVQVGNFRLEFTDIALPLAGIPIEINRVYDTETAADVGDFGYGWTLGAQDARILETTAQINDFVAGETKVYLTGPDGRRVGFTYEEEPLPLAFSGGAPIFTGFFGDQIFRPYFVADPGVTAELTVDREVISRGGLSGAFNFASQALSGSAGTATNNFDQYTLTTTDGLAYRYDQFAGLQTITDRNNNVVTFTDTAITHSSGQSIELRRDFRGRLSEIVVPTADGDDPISLSYRYDARGDLVEFSNQIGLSTTYEYLSDPAHYLESAFDHDGVRVLGVQYDDQGRYVGVFDAAGNLIDSRDYDSDRNMAVIRDGRGSATTLVYDDRGNVLTETDPLGNVTIRRYEDPVNPDLETTIIDRDGFITEQSFDESGNLLSIRQTGTAENPLVAPVVTTFSYDGENNLISVTSPNNTTTAYDYDTAGDLRMITNP